MGNIRLHVEKESLHKSASSAITGTIYFDFGEIQFPEKQWNDFVVIVLDWWLDAAIRLSSKISAEEEFSFMDGPFYFLAKRIDDKKCWIDCYSRRLELAPIFSGVLSIDGLSKTILKAAKEVRSACDENDWLSDDLSRLVSRIEALSQQSRGSAN